jgi:hypothetical protein
MNSKNRVSVVGLVGLVVLAMISFGCGTVIPPPPPPITVSVSAGTTALHAGGTTHLTATVINDSANMGVTWSVSCPTAPCGTVSPTATASGAATTYTAPTTPPSGNLPVIIAATSVSHASAKGTATVTIAGPAVPSLTITTPSLPNGTVNVPYSVDLQSLGGTLPVTWSVATGTALPLGLSLSSDGKISGTPTVPGSTAFLVFATDSTTPTPQVADQAFSIGINPTDASHNALLNGHYAFLMSGFSHLSGLPTAVLYASAGSFVADGNGNLTSGVLDTNFTGGVTADEPFTGTYTLGSNNRGMMFINTSLGQIGLAFSVGSISSGVATKGRTINFGTGLPTAGEFDLQDTSGFSNSAINGSYAFALSGWGVDSKQFGVDGVFTSDGAGSLANGSFDQNFQGMLTSNQSLTGTYNVASGSTTGRGTGILTITGMTVNVAFYVVSANKMLIVSAEKAIDPLVFIGQALKQFGGPFNNGSLSGTSVFTTTGAGALKSVAGGLGTFDGSGTVTLLQDNNDTGIVTLSAATSEAYSVSSNGRATETAAGSAASVLYLVSPGEGFFLNTDVNGAVGFFEPQSPGPFTDSSISGSFSFGSLPPCYLATVSTGVAVLSAGTTKETSDKDEPINGGIGGVKVSLSYDQASMDTFTVSSNGRVTTGSGHQVIYIISPTKFLVIDVNPADTSPSIMVAEQ